MKERFPSEAALDAAREICDRLAPYCEKLIVAGSLRRKSQSVGDVEILYVPKIGGPPQDLFSNHFADLAEEEITRMLNDRTITKRPNKNGSSSWGDQNKLALHRSGLPVDLFSTSLGCWFNYLVCRTGPLDSNKRIATLAQRKGFQWNPYGPGFTRLVDGAVVPMRSEAAVFEFVGLPYAEPSAR